MCKLKTVRDMFVGPTVSVKVIDDKAKKVKSLTLHTHGCLKAS